MIICKTNLISLFSEDNFNFAAEDPVLWIRSETIGYIVNLAACGSRMMECRRSAAGGLEGWNVENPPEEDWV